MPINAPRLRSIGQRAARARGPVRIPPAPRENPAPLVDVNQLQLSPDPEALTEDMKFIFGEFLRLLHDQERIAQLFMDDRNAPAVVARWRNNTALMGQLVIVAATLLDAVGGGGEFTPRQFWDMATARIERDMHGPKFRSFMEHMKAAPSAPFGIKHFDGADRWERAGARATSPGEVFEAMLALLDLTSFSMSAYTESAQDQWGKMLALAYAGEGDPAALRTIDDMEIVGKMFTKSSAWKWDSSQINRLFNERHGRPLLSVEMNSQTLQDAFNSNLRSD